MIPIATTLEFPFEFESIEADYENSVLTFRLPDGKRLDFPFQEGEDHRDTLKRVYNQFNNVEKNNQTSDKNQTDKEDGENRTTQLAVRLKNADIPFVFARSPLFLPYEKLLPNNPIVREFKANDNILTLENQWYSVQIRNRLLHTRHLKAIIAAILTAKEVKINQSQITIKFNIYSVAKKAGFVKDRDSYGGKNMENIRKLFHEIADVRIVIGKKTTKKEEDFRIAEELDREDDMFTMTFSKKFSEKVAKEFLVNVKKLELNINPLILKLILFTHTQNKQKIFHISFKSFLELNNVYSKKMIFNFRNILKEKETIEILAKNGVSVDFKKEILTYESTDDS